MEKSAKANHNLLWLKERGNKIIKHSQVDDDDDDALQKKVDVYPCCLVEAEALIRMYLVLVLT